MNTTKLKLISQLEVENGSVKGFPDVVAGDATVLKNAFVKPSLNIAQVMNANTEVLVTSLGNVDNTSDADKPISTATQTAFDGMWNLLYPIGCIYQSTNAANPSSLFGGVWQRFGEGRVLVGVDENDPSFNVVKKEGGEKTHTLNPLEAPKMPTLGSTVPTGGETQELYPVLKRAYGSESTTSFSGVINPLGGGAHNNLQPYTTVYMWLRTA